ncbi:MAG: Gfo/Idh/MocA family oxidoreductase [Planctomycetaceae bacterium]|nr:Gfo/Idh/MocA family oxidoreductase [Planctomycetales bacterium]MCB9921606.1 Gfo/Idh/MocA family oxidoreductase [Planctomycetaceae bacterium]
MPSQISRRRFVQSAALSVAGGYLVNPTQAQQTDSPNERLNIACVGATGRAGADIAGVSSQNIIAIADVDADLLEKGSAKYPSANKYRDFRVMLEKEADKIDAVVVGSTDHTHAPAAAMAMRMKKHCYCEKPLTHTVYEARVLAGLAKENHLVTQMGTQIHSMDNYRRVVELVETGAIGPIREVHVWASAVYTGGKFTTNTSAPKNLDWDLWLGPAVERPYSEGVHPFNWRRFWDYGTGALGDFGCHYMDLVHWALKLRNPTSVSAQGPEYDPVSTPAWCVVDYEYPARGDLPPVKLTWYDSGKKPSQLESIIKRQPLDQNGKPMNAGSGQLFVGEKGMILSNYTQRSFVPAEDFSDFRAPDPYIPESLGHHEEWLNAIKSGGPTTCNFDYSGALTESVLLGTVAYRSGEKVEWDSANLKVTNSEKAQQFVHKEYRKGWTL